MRALVVVLVLLPALAHASPSADDNNASRDLVIEYTRIARGAAIGGNCEIARDLAPKVKALDEAYYTASFVTDEAIATCLPPPAAAPIVPGIEPPLAPPSAAPVRPLRVAPPIDRVAPIDPDRPDKPPIDGGKIVGEIFLGYLGAALGLAVGGAIGVGLCADDSGEFACLGSLIIGAGLGGTFMLAAGVWAVGKDDRVGGSFGWTWFGALTGLAVGIGAAAGAQGDDGGAVTLLIAAPMVGALIGFNASRHWNNDGPRVGSLIRLDRGRAALGIPLVTHAEIRGTPTTTIPLFSGSF